MKRRGFSGGEWRFELSKGNYGVGKDVKHVLDASSLRIHRVSAGETTQQRAGSELKELELKRVN